MLPNQRRILSGESVMSTGADTYLELKDLKTHFPIRKGLFFQKEIARVRAVDGVNLKLKKGEVLGLVGESGCGKSTLGRTVMQLLRATEGEVSLEGQSLTQLNARQLRELRPRFQMIFQDPYASLDPRMTVFDTLAEPMLVHGIANSKNVTEKVRSLMNEVKLAPRFVKKYPHEFSGGQRQRIAIARALALNPELIIADEPVSALDVSIQSQILNLLMELKNKRNLTLIFISHDLSVIRYISDRVAVMYLGKIVETGAVGEVFQNPRHPYTRALLSAIPLPDPEKERTRKRLLLEGDPPSPIKLPVGCRFHPRCRYAVDACKAAEPTLTPFGNVSTIPHDVACIRAADI